MSKPVAFCLAENGKGQVLLIQRGYGKEKGKWSLPGGLVDHGESYQQAAAREMREETGLKVEIISTILKGRSHPFRSFYGVIKGGQLRIQKRECLDARFFSYGKLPELAFGADRRAIDSWQSMKSRHSELMDTPLPSYCPSCGSGEIGLRRYPHKTPYRCRSCNRVF